MDRNRLFRLQASEILVALRKESVDRNVWLCMAAQRGYEGSYADRSDSSYPAGDPAGIDLAASTAARAQEASTTAATELLEIDTGADETADILLDESERLT